MGDILRSFNDILLMCLQLLSNLIDTFCMVRFLECHLVCSYPPLLVHCYNDHVLSFGHRPQLYCFVRPHLPQHLHPCLYHLASLSPQPHDLHEHVQPGQGSSLYDHAHQLCDRNGWNQYYNCHHGCIYVSVTIPDRNNGK